MDVTSLYTNIDHEEGAQACYEKLEERSNKTIPSKTLKSLIMLVLKCTAFKFGSKIYEQVKGTCMGTPMAPNYANLFMDKFENEFIKEYARKTGLRPLVWFRYIDDVFFIWSHGSESLDDFIAFNQSFSKEKGMRSQIRFEVNKSSNEVNFLDTKITIENGHLITNLYTKPTDAFLYLNTKSNHPKHIKTNIPKGQFIRVRRICSKHTDFLRNCAILSTFFEKRGYNSKELKKTIQEISKIPRTSLLDETQKSKTDQQSIFVCDWHPNVSRLPAVLKKHFHLLQNDRYAKDIFTSTPIVAYRRPRSLKNILVKSDLTIEMSPRKQENVTKACNRSKCKLCKSIASTGTITNSKKGIRITAENGGTCQSTNLIYAAICTRHDIVCIGQTGATLSSRFNRHRHDIKNRPDNSEIAEHFHENHDVDDLRVMILQTGLSKSEEQREFYEDRWICRLQSLKEHNSSGINKNKKFYAKEMYELFNKTQ